MQSAGKICIALKRRVFSQPPVSEYYFYSTIFFSILEELFEKNHETLFSVPAAGRTMAIGVDSLP